MLAFDIDLGVIDLHPCERPIVGKGEREYTLADVHLTTWSTPAPSGTESDVVVHKPLGMAVQGCDCGQISGIVGVDAAQLTANRRANLLDAWRRSRCDIVRRGRVPFPELELVGIGTQVECENTFIGQIADVRMRPRSSPKAGTTANVVAIKARMAARMATRAAQRRPPTNDVNVLIPESSSDVGARPGQTVSLSRVGTNLAISRGVGKSRLPPSGTSGGRWVDGLILPDGPNRMAKTEEVDVDGKDVVLVQTKANRLGMYLMGQAVFSQQLMIRTYSPKRAISVALCTQDDDVLRPMLEAFDDIIVVIAPNDLGTD